LSSKTENPDSPFPFNFEKFKKRLKEYINVYDSACGEFGELVFSTSIFDLPDNFDSWHLDNPGIREVDIEKVKRNVFARTQFSGKALAAGFDDKGIHRPVIKPYMVKGLAKGKYREKMVDSTVVALMVKSAITKPDDYHVVVTGDADIIPAISVAFPSYTERVVLATSHPDELKSENRQTSYDLSNFEFSISPFYFQDHLDGVIDGKHVYKCVNCPNVFVRSSTIAKGSRPYCKICARKRT